MHGRARILVVDDDPLIRQILKKELEKANCVVLLLEDGHQALEQATQWKPDLILLDILMPGATGVDICKKLKADLATQHVPVVMITSLNRPDDVVSGFQAGASDYIAKPFNEHELMARVRTQLRACDSFFQLLDLEKHLALGRLSSGVYHELHRPVTDVLKQLETLKRVGGNEEAVAAVAQAQASAERVEQLLARLAQYAEAPPKPLQSADLNAIVLSSLGLATIGLESRRIVLEVNTSPGPLPVKGDPQRLRQVFVELFANATQVMPTGGRLVTTTGVDKDGERVFASVSDTGKGIKRVDLPHVFDPFWTSKEHWRSLGLGLSIAERVIDAHGGEMDVASVDGQGTTVKVWLPRAAIED